MVTQSQQHIINGPKMETVTENNYLHTHKAKLLKKPCLFQIEDNNENFEEIIVVLHSITSLGRLGVGDLIDGQTYSALGNDIRDAIANLDAHHCVCSVDAQHWEEVHDWVCAPADHRHHLCSLDLAFDHWICLAVGGIRKANEEFVHNVQEEHHGNEPAHPPWGQVASDDQFAIVARNNHQSSSHSQGLGLIVVVPLVKLHHQENLDEQQRHSQEPVHVTVSIVEWDTSQFWGVELHGTTGNFSWRMLVCAYPRVEDTHVMVRSDEGHQTRDQHCAPVPVLHCKGAKPQIHRGRHHARKREGQDVVHSLVLQVAHLVHRHGFGCESQETKNNLNARRSENNKNPLSPH